MELSCCDELVYMMIMMSTKLTCGFEVLIIYALLINVSFTNLAFQALLYPFYLLLANVAYKDLVNYTYIVHSLFSLSVIFFSSITAL